MNLRKSLAVTIAALAATATLTAPAHAKDITWGVSGGHSARDITWG